MTSNEIKKMVLEANARVDLCLSFLSKTELNSFVKYLKKSSESLNACRSAISSNADKVGSELCDLLMDVIRTAASRLVMNVSIGSRVFGMEELNAALKN